MISKVSGLPTRLVRLHELAYNLWWSWHYPARGLFRSLEARQWTLARHNPVRFLRQLPPAVLEAAARDGRWLSEYDRVMEALDHDLADADHWFSTEFPSLDGRRPIAYFSAEFGIHHSLPIYSGGLGILAGDHCKESSDLGLPFCGLGFVYPQGYFHQSIQADGWQQDVYELLDREIAPLRPALGPDGRTAVIELKLDGAIHVMVWVVRLGRVALYLMDTDVEQNAPGDRDLTARLYGGDREHRLRQEIVLGVGGVRVLRALGVDPAAWHANEGHTAFMLLERVREHVAAGLSFSAAVEAVRATSVFTTHTPVPAGNDAFPFAMVEQHFHGYWDELGLTRDGFMAMGAHEDAFNMTVLALRLAGHANGVSQLHGRVSRRMWRTVWPDRAEDETPIGAITNGVHAPSWIAHELDTLFTRHLGADWVDRHDDPRFWERLDEIPDEEFWEVHTTLKRKLIGFARERARARWAEESVDARQVIAMGTLLDPDALTIGFARRFTAYKRASLIFEDLERIRALLTDHWRPVQIIFAGKAHPADEHGRRLIQQIYSLAADARLAGHVAFVENYDMHAARFLVQGVDVWLNNPRPPLEACGTSGQKAGMNGVLNLSVPDGWWFEGYDGENGWRIGDPPAHLEPAYDDARDAERLYTLLEQEVVPLYYDREGGLPRRWIQKARRSMRTIIPNFSARRMLKDYTRQSYAPALAAAAIQADGRPANR